MGSKVTERKVGSRAKKVGGGSTGVVPQVDGEPAVEVHPLRPFIPDGARLLMLGSFPPPRERWSMDFFYPNTQNDMWRIFGLVFFVDKDHFLVPGVRKFDKDKLCEFLTDRGVALGDTARAVVRHKGNASDKFLSIVEPLDLAGILASLPDCRTIATTGELASQTLSEITRSPQPKVGEYQQFIFDGRELRHYRMPSSSRAYPKPVAEKAEIYGRMLREAGIL